MANGNPKEETIDAYFERAIIGAGGCTRRIIYRGRKGCADHLCGFPFNRLFLVELKRPRGGKISANQHDDAKYWLQIGVRKEFLHTQNAVDAFVRRVASFGQVKCEAECQCDRCLPL